MNKPHRQTTSRQSTVAVSKARTAFLARNLDVGCPEVLHERPTFTVPEPDVWFQ